MGKKYFIVWEIVNIIVSFLCMILSIRNNINYNFYLLPLVFSLLFFICKNLKNLIGKYPGITVCLFVMFMRYVIFPLILCKSGNLSIYAKNYNNINWAIIIMIYEMIAIFLTLDISTKYTIKFNKSKKNRKKEEIKIRTPFIIVLIIVILLGGIYITNTNLLNSTAVFAKDSIDESITDTSGMIKIVWQCLTTWIFIFFINIQKKKYDKSTDNKYIIFSIILSLCFIGITYISQSRISRWYTLVSAVSSIFLLRVLFPQKKKSITIIIIVPAIILILIASFLKSGVNSVFDLITVTSGDAYFAGPVSVNNAIGLAKSCSVGITNIIYDFFNNMPIVNHFIKSGNSTVYLYNLYLGRIFSNSSGDQIIPLVGQSYIFFGWILSPLLSVVSIILMRIADKQFFYATNYMKYVWAFISIWFGLETILNMTINLSWIYIRIIPLFITFWFIEKISYKQKIEKRM